MTTDETVTIEDERVSIAFLVAPAVCAPVFVAANFGFLLALDGSSAVRDLISLVIGAIFFVLPAAYGTETVLGIPLYLLLRSRNRLSVVNVTVSGALAGLAVATLFAVATQSFEPAVFIAGGSSAVAAAVWWRIAAGTWTGQLSAQLGSCLGREDRCHAKL